MESNSFDIRKIGSVLKFALTVFRRFWYVIILGAVLGTAIGYYFDKKNAHPTQYSAKIVFNLDTASPGGSELGDLAGVLGISAGGGGGNGGSSLFAPGNFFQIVKSKKLVNRVLLSTVEDKGKKIILGNLFIERSGFPQKLRRKKLLAELQIDSLELYRFEHTDIKKFNKTDLKWLSMLRDELTEQVYFSNVDKKSSFVEVKHPSDYDTLAILVVETYIKQLIDFHEETKSKSAYNSLKFAENRSDSLFRVMSRSERTLTKRQDMSQFMVNPSRENDEFILGQKRATAQALYAQSSQQVDMMRASKSRENRLLTIIDEPIFPLFEVKYPAGQATKGGLTIGLLLALILALLLNTYQKKFSGK